jgi:hypothetical protein
LHTKWRNRRERGGENADASVEHLSTDRKDQRDRRGAEEDGKIANRKFGKTGNRQIKVEEVIVQRRMRIDVFAFKRNRDEVAVRGVDAKALIAPHPQLPDLCHPQRERDKEDRDENNS